MWKWAIYSSLCIVADTLDATWSSFFSPRRPPTDTLPSDVDDITNDEIIKLIEKASPLFSDAAIFMLTPNTVAKISQDIDEACPDASEANALDLIFSSTTIPVPRVRRVVKQKWNHLIIMDNIPGRTLAEVWPDFSMWQKVKVAWTLRRYVRQLRRLQASSTTPPGPLSAHGPRTCVSPLFGQV